MREGYKKTEVGIIPEDWEVKKLEEIAKICYGKSQKEVECENGQFKILGTGGVMGYTNNFLWDKPSVLIGRKGTIDRPQYIDEPFWTVDTLFYTKINNTNLPKWFYYYMTNVDLKRYNEATGVPSLSVANLNTIKIITPPLKEQEKIAEILSTVDSQIDDTEKLIEKSKVLKKGLMQKLLTKGIGHSEFKKTEVGEIPVSWEVKRLDSLCELIDGDRSSNYPSGNDIVDHGIIFLSTSNIKNNKLDYSDLKFITEEKFKSLRKGKLEKNDIIITLRGTIGSVAIFDNDNYETGFINAQMLIIRPKLANSNYLHNYLTSYIFKKQLEVISSGSAQPQLTKRDLSSIKIVLPSNNEQEKISNILLSIDNEIEEYENKKQKLEYIKRGLMQQLLTGKIRTII